MSNAIPNAEQKRWMNSVADWANNYGTYPLCVPFQIHHVKGRTYRHHKIRIGHWFILPVTLELHMENSRHPLNVTHNPKGFEKEFGTQKQQYADMVSDMIDKGYTVPDEVFLKCIATTPPWYFEGVCMDKIYKSAVTAVAEIGAVTSS